MHNTSRYRAAGGNLAAGTRRLLRTPALRLATGFTPAAKPPTTPSAGEKDAADPVSWINRLLAQRWQENHLQPSDRTSDQEFIRRLSLDVVGRIATVDEVHAFEKDSRPDKRS